MTTFKYSGGSTVTFDAPYTQSAAYDLDIARVIGTDLSLVRKQGRSYQRIVWQGSVTSKEAINWNDIVAVSFDGGTSYQTVYAVSAEYASSGFSDLWPVTVTMIANPARMGTAHQSSTVFGLASVAVPAHVGLAPILLTYQGAVLHVPLQSSLAAVDGAVAVSFARAGIETYGGVMFGANVPIYDSGLVLDTGNAASVTLPRTVSPFSLAMRISSHRYPSAWVVGGSGMNLLTANQSNIETDTTGLTTGGSGTLTRDTSTPLYGAASAKIVSGGSYDLTIRTATTAVAVTAGNWYAVQALVKCSAASGRQIKIGVMWYTSADVLISTTYAPSVSAAATIAQLKGYLQAPATAAKAYVCITLVASISAEYFFADCLAMELIPTSLGILSNTGWTLAMNTPAGTLVLTAGASTVSCTVDVGLYLSGTPTTVILTLNGTAAVVACKQVSWTRKAGTLAVAPTTGAKLTLGCVSTNYLMGALEQLVQYPYVLTQDEYEAIVLTSMPLVLGSLHIAERWSGTVTMQTDGTLTDANGNDVSGCMSGAVPVAETTLSMTDGLSARWFVTVYDSWRL